MADGSNERFTEAVTTQAFALTLSRAMIEALAGAVAAADRGDVLMSNERGPHGLERRGLVAWSAVMGADGRPVYGWLPTRAGRLTLELCRCAGLQPGDPGDDFLASIAERMAIQAEQDREVTAEQERRHRELFDSIKIRERTTDAGR
jgi:hypothetical protein